MPIIDPMYLYLIEVLHNLDVLNQGVFLLASIILGLLVFMYVNMKYDLPGSDLSEVKKYLKIVIGVWLVTAIIAIFVPTKDAMYKMLLAHYVTTDNIQLVNDAIKVNLQDYLNMLGETVKNLR